MKNHIDTNVTIIGSGPAALTAAIYCSRAELKPVLFEGITPGGQLTTTTDVENFPGFPEGVDGYDLVSKMREQAVKYGTKIYTETINTVDFSEKPYLLKSNCVIIACTVYDDACPIFRNKPVVVGSGDSAMEEAIFLTKFASKVYIVHRRDKLRASKYM